MLDKIQQLKDEIQNLHVSSAAEVEDLRIKYLSKKGAISQLMNDFRTVAPELKRELGQKLNELKNMATDRINTLREEAAGSSEEKATGLDLTRTSAPLPLGSRHPLNIVRNKIIDIFARLGFSIAEGPEIEDDWHVFPLSILPPTILHATCRTPFLSSAIRPMCCSAPTLHPCRPE